MRRSYILLAVAAFAALAACTAGRHSSSGFRLPDTGNTERGKAVFIATGCAACHRVAGAETPAPTVTPVVPVVLGGDITVEMTDGYLVTSIINPSHRLAAYPRTQIIENGKSRMPVYAENLSVRDLTDLVAFLQSHYTVRNVRSAYSTF